MPRYRIDYTQPVHATYSAVVTADNAIEAVRKLLAVEGNTETQAYREAVRDDVQIDGTASEIIWDAMEPVQLGFITDIEEQHDEAEEPTLDDQPYILVAVFGGVAESVTLHPTEAHAIDAALGLVAKRHFEPKTDDLRTFPLGGKLACWEYDPEAYGKDLDSIESIYLQP